MEVCSSPEPLQTPERLDGRFGLVVGLYVASLLSPSLVFVVGQQFGFGSWPIALGSLGALEVALTVVVARVATRNGALVAWFDSDGVAVLVPAVGLLPMGLYGIQFLIVVGFALTTLEAASPAPLVGFAGFCLGMAAMILGGFIVPMARTRVAAATVAESDVAVEWTAGYPVRARLRFLAGTLAVVGLVAGVAVWQLGWSAATAFLPSLLPPVVVATSLLSERTYRATPAGLELRRGPRWYASRHLLPWPRFQGFSVTDDAIVLHRALPRIDVRCRRDDFRTDEDAVVGALEAHLDRRDS